MPYKPFRRSDIFACIALLPFLAAAQAADAPQLRTLSSPSESVITDGLQDPDPIVRADYIKSASDALSSNDIRRAWHDPNPQVRAQSLQILGGATLFNNARTPPQALSALFNTPSTRRELIGLVNKFPSDGELKQRVLSILNPWPEDGLPLAEMLLGDPSLDVQLSAIRYRVRHQVTTPPRMETPQDIDQWDNWSIEQRQAALVSLADRPTWGDAALPKPTKTKLGALLASRYADAEPTSRCLISLVAMTLRFDSAFNAVFEQASHDSDPCVRRLVLIALDELQVESQKRVIQEVLVSTDKRLRQELADSNPSKHLRSSLLPLFSDQDAEVRATALRNAMLDPDGTKFHRERLVLLEQALADPGNDTKLPGPWWVKQFRVAQSDDLLSVARKFMNSSNGFHRQWAAEALPKHPQDITLLTTMTRDRSSSVRSAAINAIAERGNETARQILESLLSSPNVSDRSRALAGLGTIGMSMSWRSVAISLLDQDASIRRQAVNALAEIGAVEIGPQVAMLLTDADSSVRAAAIKAIGRLGLIEYGTRIAQALNDPNWKVRISAFSSLIDLKYNGAEQEATAALSQSVSSPARLSIEQRDLRKAAVTYLEKFASEQSVPALTRLIQSDDIDLAENIIRVLATRGLSSAIPALIEALESDQIKIVRAACDALGTLKAAEAWPALIKAARRGIDTVEVLTAIGRISDAAPDLLTLDQPRMQLLANASGLSVAYPLRFMSIVEPMIDNLTPDELKEVFSAWFLLQLSVQPRNVWLELVKRDGEKHFMSLMSLSTEADRRSAVEWLSRKLSAYSVNINNYDVSIIIRLVVGDRKQLEQLLARDPESLSPEERDLAFVAISIDQTTRDSPTIGRILPTLLREFDDSKAEILGHYGFLSRNTVSSEILSLPAKHLAAAIAAAPRFGRAWLTAYMSALQRADDEDRLALLSAAVMRSWTTDGIDRSQFISDARLLLSDTKSVQPELAWIMADLLKEIGAAEEALKWIEAIRSPPDVQQIAHLSLAWLRTEILWRGGRLKEALATLEAAEAGLIPRITKREKIGSPLPIDAYTLMLKGAILSDMGRKTEAVKLLLAAEDRLNIGYSGGSSEGSDRVAALIRSYRAEAMRESAKADTKAALGYFEQAKKSDSSLLERDAEDRATETQIRLFLGDGNFEEAHRLAERLALRRHSSQAGGNLVSRSPDRQSALDAVTQLRTAVKAMEEKIRSLTSPRSAEHLKPDDLPAKDYAPSEVKQSDEESRLLSALKKERNAAQRRLKQHFTDLKRSHPEIASLVGAEPTELAHIQKLLKPDQALVQYLVLNDRGWAFVATGNSIDVVDLQVSRLELAEMIKRYRSFLQEGEAVRGVRATIRTARTDASSGRWLADRLLAPLQKHLANIQQLIVVPQGDLHWVPFAALPFNSGYLIESFVLSQIPSATLWSLVGKGTGGINKLLALGNPLPPSSEWTALPGAEAEVQAITGKFPAHMIEAHLRESATRKQLTDRSLAQWALHLALHGTAGAVDKTHLVLSDGYLGVQDIWGLSLDNSPLVVLSACETAIGERLPGDEVTSLTNGFLFAGAKSVIGSLWKVPDEPTQHLFVSFYDHLIEGRSPAFALAAAQRLSIKDGLPPAAWSAFVVAGP